MTFSLDTEPSYVLLCVHPIGGRWVAMLLADEEPPPEAGAVKGLAFLGATPEEAGQAVDRAKRRLRAQGARVTGTVCYVHAAAERLAAVHEFEPDLFVLGAKGRHSPPETELRHVARKVMDHVPCSALIVRP